MTVPRCLGFAGGTEALAHERIVDPRGGDYATLQTALDAAEPGDLITIRGGIYQGYAVTRRSGEQGRPITIRAAPNQEVLLQAGTRLEGDPQSVPDFPEVFRWPAVGLKEAIASNEIGFWEAPTHLRLKRVFTLEECASRLASWFYAPATESLFLRSSGLSPARELPYFCENVEHAVLEINHSHIVVENLNVAFGKHGICIDDQKAEQVTVRGCRTYCNRSAGIYACGDHHRIERNEVFHNNQYGIQLRHNVNYTNVLNNLAYFNGPNNGEGTDSSVPADLSMYSQGIYNLFEGNVLDGLHQNTFRIKYGGNNANIVRHNVIKGFFDSSAPCIENNTLLVNGLGPRFGGYVNRVVPDSNPDPERTDPGGNQRRTNLLYPVLHKEDPRFADPAWRDYRLQSDSPYRDKGAFPAVEIVLYVDPERGDDTNQGRSAVAAFRTLTRAVAALHPGYTLYLMPGIHTEPLYLIFGGLDAQDPIRVRAFGNSFQTVLTGGVVIELGDPENAKEINTRSFATIPPEHIVLEGLIFKGKGVRLTNTANIRLEHCIWDVPETALQVETCRNVRVNHATLVGGGTGILVRASYNTTVCRSLFAGKGSLLACDAQSLETLQTYFNAYSPTDWLTDDHVVKTLEAWQVATPGESGGIVQPISLAADYTLPTNSPLLFAADDFAYLGACNAPAHDRLEIRNLRTAGLAPDATTLLWETPRGSTESSVYLHGLDDGSERTWTPVSTFQIWGEFFDMSFRAESFFMAERHVGLTDLVPGARYEAKVTATNAAGTAHHSQTLRFTTPKTLPNPRILYVASAGSDTASGRSPTTAWRSLRHAVTQVAPGDTVRVLPGVYAETLRPRISGTAERPIRFESVEPHGAVIDLKESLSAAMEVFNVNHVQMDGFAITNGKFTVGHIATIAQGRGIQVSGCHVRYPEGASFEKLKLGHSGIVAADAPDLLIEDNVFLCGTYAVGMGRCPGARILHNTIVGEGNYGIAIVPDSPDEDYTIRNNLFYRSVMGYKAGCVLWVFNVAPRLDSDYNLFYIPADHKGTIGMIVDSAVRYKTLVDWQAATGHDRHSLEALAQFVDPEGGDFRLAKTSPGYTVAEDGGPVGARSR